MAVKGSPLDNLEKFLKPLFQSRHDKELEAIGRQRRIQYLRRKHSTHVHIKRKGGDGE